MSAEMTGQAHRATRFHKMVRTNPTIQDYQQRSQVMSDLLVIYGRADLRTASRALGRMIQELLADFRKHHPSLRADGKIAW